MMRMKLLCGILGISIFLLMGNFMYGEDTPLDEVNNVPTDPPTTTLRFQIGDPAHRYELLNSPPQVDAIPVAEFEVSHAAPGQLLISFALQPGEAIWGCGQRFDAFNLRGTRLEHWVTDGWNRLDTSYFAVPFFISSEGYGLFVNHPGRIRFDIGQHQADRFLMLIPDDGVELIYFEGTPAEISKAYTELVGRPRSAPYWIFRPWMSRNSYYGAEEITTVVDRMAALGMPVGVVVLEAWAEQLHNFRFEQRRYPLPITWMRDLEQAGVRVVCWITPSVWQNSLAYNQARENGWLVLNDDGSEHVVRWLEDGRKIDFRIPEARDWWRDLQVHLIEMGVSGIKTDGGEHMPDPIFHNQHPYDYQRASLDAFVEAGREGITFARSGGPLNAGLSTFWAGDQHAEWSSLAAVVRGSLSAALSGFPLWGHDIGGYSGVPEKELYIRWLQFGAVSPIMQFHGVDAAREPWHYDAETVDIARFYFELRERLQPWLSQWGQDAVNDGIPIIRPLIWHFPDDPASHDIDSQFMLGPDLLFAPLVDESGTRSIYLPDEEWVDLWTGERITGPTTLQRTPALHELPAFVRESAHSRFEYLFADPPLPDTAPVQVRLTGTKNARGIVPPRRFLHSGQTHERFEYKVTNKSNVEQILGVRLAPTMAGIHVHPNQIIRFALLPGETRDLVFEVSTAFQTPPGTYPLRLEIRGEQQDWPAQTVEVVISPQWHALGLFEGGVGSDLNIDPTSVRLRGEYRNRRNEAIGWVRVPADIMAPDGLIDLSPVIGGDGFSTSYLRTNIHSEWLRRVNLVVGSGDGITIWLNGREILNRPIHRNSEPDQDRVPGVLMSGDNEIVVRLHRDLAPHHLYFRVE